MTVLQREPGRTVTLEADGSTVRKTFHGDDLWSLGQLAAREFERMSAFHDVLQDVDGAACPAPLDLVLHPEPYLRMERAAGMPLQDHLAQNVWEPERYGRVAGIMASALLRYVGTFAEPYWDFILRNMFYDPAAEAVTFLDFGIPTIYEPILAELRTTHPVDVSLGGLVASSVFEAARPRRLVRRLEHRQAPQLALAVLERCLEDPDGLDVSGEGVRKAAHAAYGVAGSGGPWSRRLWYRGVGPVLAPPSKIDRLCSGR